MKRLILIAVGFLMNAGCRGAVDTNNRNMHSVLAFCIVIMVTCFMGVILIPYKKSDGQEVRNIF